MNRRTVVLLGIGHTNAHVVKQWSIAPIRYCDLVCVSNFPTATYSGMLPGTLACQFQYDEMRIDLVKLAEQAGANLLIAEVIGLNLPARQLLFADRKPLSFDILSIGVGSMPAQWEQH